MTHRWNKAKYFLVGILMPGIETAQAGNHLFFNSGLGLATYKSQIVESNDTNQTIGYALSLDDGEDWSMTFARELSKTGFTYADSDAKSSITLALEDTILSYHLGWVLLGLVFSHGDLTSTNQDVDQLNLMSLSQGAYLGFHGELAKSTEVFLDVIYTTATKTKDSVQPDTDQPKMGTRMDIFAGGKVNITKSMVKALLGYKRRTMDFTVASKSKKEEQTMTWVGLEIMVPL
jgi:hypothetical protein